MGPVREGVGGWFGFWVRRVPRRETTHKGPVAPISPFTGSNGTTRPLCGDSGAGVASRTKDKPASPESSVSI